MDLGVISLVLLLLAIILGFFRKTNVGLVSLLFALILGRLAGMNDASILKGFIRTFSSSSWASPFFSAFLL